MAVQLALVKIIPGRSLAGRIDKFIEEHFITPWDRELEQYNVDAHFSSLSNK